MTEAQELAFNLGKRVIRANLRVSVMTAALDHQEQLGRRHPWRNDVDRVIQEQLDDLYRERIEELRRMLSEAMEQDLLHTLRRFLDEKVSRVEDDSPEPSGAPPVE